MAAVTAKPATPGANAMLAARTANKTPAAPVDPFAPTSPQDINATIARFTKGLPGAITPGQIQTTAQGELSPIVDAITKNIQGQASTASSQIGANSAALAKALAAVDYGAPYAGAKNEQAAVDAALQQSLNGGGASLAGDLRSRLASINDPTVGAAADAVASHGTALGTTELARGTNAMSNLIAQAAAAKEYGAKQPGIVQQSGLQDIAGVNSKATQSIADEAAKIEQLLPGIVQSLRSESQGNQSNRVSVAERLYETLTGQNITKATASAGLAGSATKLSLPDPTLSRAYGYAVDSAGNPVGGKVTPLPGYTVGPGGSVVKTPKAAAAAKPLSPSALKNLSGMAHDFYNGVPASHRYNSSTGQWVPVPGTGSAPVTWNAAIAQLVAAGSPPDKAVQLLEAQGWQPGEGGRPQSVGQKKTAAAVKSGLGVPKTAGPFAGLGG